MTRRGAGDNARATCWTPHERCSSLPRRCSASTCDASRPPPEECAVARLFLAQLAPLHERTLALLGRPLHSHQHHPPFCSSPAGNSIRTIQSGADSGQARWQLQISSPSGTPFIALPSAGSSRAQVRTLAARPHMRRLLNVGITPERAWRSRPLASAPMRACAAARPFGVAHASLDPPACPLRPE
jgi:hypothetical protein